MTPAVTIDELYLEIKKIQETMVRREDLDAPLDTIEILSNPDTMAMIQKSEEDIAVGRFREIFRLTTSSAIYPDGMDDRCGCRKPRENQRQ
jgi:antitoxin YefM